MKRPKSIEDQLREKMPPMRNQFRSALRAQLFEKAEQHLKGSSSFMNFFNPLLNHMKRYSLGYLSLMLIAVFGITTFLKTPLSAQQVLANTLENYEQTGDIYHQKLAHYSYEDDILTNSDINEYYVDQNENNLSFSKDIETEEITSTYLYTVDSFGDAIIYEASQGEKNEESINTLESAYGNEWLEKFKGEKIYCMKSQALENNLMAKAFLTLAADDYNTYNISGYLEDNLPITDPTYYSSEESDKLLNLENLEKEQFITKDYIDQLASNGAYEYSQIEEDGKSYHLFKMEQGSIWFFIDTKTYELVRYEYHYGSEPEVIDKYIVLENEFLNTADYPDLFNPNQFENLKAFPQLSVEAPFEFPGDGCYDGKIQKLEDDFLNKIPKEAITDWNDELELISEPIGEPFEATGIPENIKNEQLPTNAPLTQGYHAGHYAWDLAPEEGGDDSVYLPKDGKVLSIDQEGYNGGYGKYILISHPANDNEIITLYAHLDEIYVEQGQELKKGEIFAKMGASGRATGKHLHFEVRINGKKVDPALLWES